MELHVHRFTRNISQCLMAAATLAGVTACNRQPASLPTLAPHLLAVDAGPNVYLLLPMSPPTVQCTAAGWHLLSITRAGKDVYAVGYSDSASPPCQVFRIDGQTVTAILSSPPPTMSCSSIAAVDDMLVFPSSAGIFVLDTRTQALQQIDLGISTTGVTKLGTKECLCIASDGTLYCVQLDAKTQIRILTKQNAKFKCFLGEFEDRALLLDDNNSAFELLRNDVGEWTCSRKKDLDGACVVSSNGHDWVLHSQDNPNDTWISRDDGVQSWRAQGITVFDAVVEE